MNSLPQLTRFETRAAHDRAFALITGAGGGIGLELARIAASRGWNLCLVSKDPARLTAAAKEISSDPEAKGRRIIVHPADLSDPACAAGLEAALSGEGIQVGLLINCAGLTAHGMFAASESKKQEEILAVNAGALIRLTRMVLPEMLKRGYGKIINVASTAAFRPSPFQAVYYASKAFAMSFSLALSEETRGSGVTVTCLCPGATATGFFDRAGIEVPELAKSSLMPASRVALEGYAAMLKGRALCIPGARNKLQAHVVRLLPTRVVLWIMRRVMEPVRGRKG